MTPARNPALALPHADPVAGLLDAMRTAGIEPADPGLLVADGTLHRVRVEGDKPGSLNGWYVLRPAFGVAGSWKSGLSCTWSAKSTARMSRVEKDAFHAQMRKAKAEAQRQREADQRQAAERAADLWSKATPATPDHPYLARKHVAPGNARQSGDRLVLKIEDIDGNLHGLQYIGGSGGIKRMLTGTNKRGHFVLVAGSLPADLFVIGEGWATCSTVATQFPGACVLAAVDCGNLEPVARAVRSRYPAAQIVIASDDDRLTPGNPGLTKAREAAAAARAKLVRPVWPDGAPGTATDFNDLAVLMMEASHA